MPTSPQDTRTTADETQFVVRPQDITEFTQRGTFRGLAVDPRPAGNAPHA